MSQDGTTAWVTEQDSVSRKEKERRKEGKKAKKEEGRRERK